MAAGWRNSEMGGWGYLQFWWLWGGCDRAAVGMEERHQCSSQLLSVCSTLLQQEVTQDRTTRWCKLARMVKGVCTKSTQWGDGFCFSQFAHKVAVGFFLARDVAGQVLGDVHSSVAAHLLHCSAADGYRKMLVVLSLLRSTTLSFFLLRKRLFFLHRRLSEVLKMSVKTSVSSSAQSHRTRCVGPYVWEKQQHLVIGRQRDLLCWNNVGCLKASKVIQLRKRVVAGLRRGLVVRDGLDLMPQVLVSLLSLRRSEILLEYSLLASLMPLIGPNGDGSGERDIIHPFPHVGRDGLCILLEVYFYIKCFSF